MVKAVVALTLPNQKTYQHKLLQTLHHALEASVLLSSRKRKTGLTWLVRTLGKQTHPDRFPKDSQGCKPHQGTLVRRSTPPTPVCKEAKRLETSTFSHPKPPLNATCHHHSAKRDTVDGSEIPFPTTWDDAKTLAISMIFAKINKQIKKMYVYIYIYISTG